MRAVDGKSGGHGLIPQHLSVAKAEETCVITGLERKSLKKARKNKR